MIWFFENAKKECVLDCELRRLDLLANIAIAYLVASAVASFDVGYILLLNRQHTPLPLVPLALIGFSGSAVAALTSCLERYAAGFERENGTKEPKDAKGETFNRRMSRWFFARPFLGSIVGPVFCMGIQWFVAEADKFLSSAERLAFTAFMGGLLAKSVIDLIKGLFKNIFKG